MITEFCKICGCLESDILGRNRLPFISELRQMYWKLLKERGYSFSEIGRINERKHSTIIWGISRITEKIEIYPNISELWDKVKVLKTDKTYKMTPKKDKIENYNRESRH